MVNPPKLEQSLIRREQKPSFLIRKTNTNTFYNKNQAFNGSKLNPSSNQKVDSLPK